MWTLRPWPFPAPVWQSEGRASVTRSYIAVTTAEGAPAGPPGPGLAWSPAPQVGVGTPGFSSWL